MLRYDRIAGYFSSSILEVAGEALDRLENIFRLFGQIPDVLEDVWVRAALGDIEQAKRIIDAVPKLHPFELKYHRIESVDWESCATVLNPEVVREALRTGWK